MKKILAIDIGGSSTKCGVINSKNRIEGEIIVSNFSKKSAESNAQNWLNAIKPLLKKYKINLIGIGCPGPLDLKRGCIIETENLRSWKNFSFTDFFSRHLGAPSFIANDVHCATLGEWSQKKVSDLLVLSLGTGVGCGAIIDSKLFLGSKGWSTEAGHMSIDLGGPRCECGKRGCLEAFVGAASLIKQTPRYKNAEEIFQRAKQGESRAQKIIATWTNALAAGVGNLINLFNPKRVVLTGGLTGSFSLVEKDFRKILVTHTLAPSLKYCEISVSQLQHRAALLGAALWAQQKHGRVKNLSSL